MSRDAPAVARVPGDKGQGHRQQRLERGQLGCCCCCCCCCCCSSVAEADDAAAATPAAASSMRCLAGQRMCVCQEGVSESEAVPFGAAARPVSFSASRRVVVGRRSSLLRRRCMVCRQNANLKINMVEARLLVLNSSFLFALFLHFEPRSRISETIANAFVLTLTPPNTHTHPHTLLGTR